MGSVWFIHIPKSSGQYSTIWYCWRLTRHFPYWLIWQVEAHAILQMVCFADKSAYYLRHFSCHVTVCHWTTKSAVGQLARLFGSLRSFPPKNSSTSAWYYSSKRFTDFMYNRGSKHSTICMKGRNILVMFYSIYIPPRKSLNFPWYYIQKLFMEKNWKYIATASNQDSLK